VTHRYSIAVDPADLDLPLCVTCGQAFLWQQAPSGAWLGVDGNDWYRVEVGLGTLEVASSADEERFRRLFRLDVDLAQVKRQIEERAPELAPYLARHPGLRMMRPSSATEVLFSFLCSANNHLARIMPMARKLAEYGPVLAEFEGIHLHAFPDVATIAQIDEDALRRAGFGYRGKTIPECARAILTRGDGWLDRLAEMPFLAMREALIELPSIGPKLADCIALYGYDKQESAPIDTHLWQVGCRLYFPEWTGKAITEHRYRALADRLRSRLGELTGYAQQFMFFDNVQNWRQHKRQGTAKGVS